jgi:hypothetical protein
MAAAAVLVVIATGGSTSGARALAGDSAAAVKPHPMHSSRSAAACYSYPVPLTHVVRHHDRGCTQHAVRAHRVVRLYGPPAALR